MARVMLAVFFFCEETSSRHSQHWIKENAIIGALYVYQEDGEPKSMLATHVDDMLWATKSGYEDRVQQLLERFSIKTVESVRFDSVDEK